MDDHRFDQIARTLASGTPRRTFLKAIAASVFGAAATVKVTDDTGAACKSFGRTCAAPADCCTGLTCAGGVCKCGPGQEKCTANGAIQCVEACPPDQYMGSGCRCLCRATGRPPEGGSCFACVEQGGECSEGNPCCEGLTCARGICVPPQICAGDGEECSEQVPCCEGFTCDGICFPLTCLEQGDPCSPPGENSSCCSGCCVIGLEQTGVCAGDFNQCAP